MKNPRRRGREVAIGSRRGRLRLPLVLLVACAGLLAAEASARQPNVVVLLADDLGWADVGFHGGEIETPSIDRIAKEGVVLDRYYAAPICSPTRAALLTGRDPIELGIAYDQINPWNVHGLAASETTLAELLKADGYQTAIVGKWHLGHTQEHQLPRAQGFDRFYGHLHTNTNYYKHTRESGHDLQENGKSVQASGEYLTHLEAREAVRFIRERDPAKPFFLYVPFTAPHSPMQAPKATIDKYSKLPLAGYRRVYAAMVDEMDQAVGQILAALDEEEIAEETIVFFASDNGGTDAFGGVNAPLRGFKGQTFEGGIRVVATIRWPDRLEAGGRLEAMMTVMDVMPTLASAVGVPIRSSVALDGLDMWPAIARDQRVLREKPVGFASEIPLPGTIHLALFDGRFKLVQVLRELQTETKVENLLFDIEADPEEKDDLAGRHPAVLQRMQRLLSEWRRRHPMAGTRSTLVAPPGWVAPKDWALAVLPSSLLQPSWKNELPFSKAILDATAQRGVLVDEATKKDLLERDARRQRRQGEKPTTKP
ncbi:sulfatase-like hydrolase/transferase [Myxococcota bacterium]|nr:sulfatase-like hydrolase/transferase [Myxococcota bacterium]